MIKVHGINEENTNMVATDILDLADASIARLYDIEALVSDSEQYLQGDIQEALKKKFAELAANFPTIKENIISYAEELNRIVNLYHIQEENLNLEIRQNANNTKLDI